ncbi:MAG: ParM/StbA family protein [Anaerolineae bacterium]|nr:ParM/StbA family protein [Anaerolineae bacterium]
MKKSKEGPASNHLFSFDLGNGYCKVKSVEVAAEYPAIYGVLSRRNTLVNLHDHLTLEFNGTRYVFGEDVRLLCDTEPTALTSRIRYTSDRYRLLFASALMRTFGHRVGEGVLYPRGVISIPVGEFNIQKDKEVRDLLQGEYAIHNLNFGTLYVQMAPQDLIIIPEGLGTFWLEAFGPEGQLDERFTQGSVAVVDIGYYTTDVVLLQNGLYVVGGAQSADIGMGSVAAAVLEELRRQGAYGVDVWEVDQHIGQDSLEVNGISYPLETWVEKEVLTLTERVLNFANTTLRGKNVRTVILAGGGGQLIAPYLEDERYANWHLSVSPRRGNVEGAFQFLLRREQGG